MKFYQHMKSENKNVAISTFFYNLGEDMRNFPNQEKSFEFYSQACSKWLFLFTAFVQSNAFWTIYQ